MSGEVYDTFKLVENDIMNEYIVYRGLTGVLLTHKLADFILSKYEMPISNTVNEVVCQRARNGGWWQRRVYDLALKMYFSDEDRNNYFSLSIFT
jgi:hypothetical protein